jgi:hypothetical protein
VGSLQHRSGAEGKPGNPRGNGGEISAIFDLSNRTFGCCWSSIRNQKGLAP